MFKHTTTSLSTVKAALVITLMLVFFGSPAYAVDWSESPDAGDLPGTAQVTSGQAGLALDSITGTVSDTQDRDMYMIQIVDPILFSATTFGGDTSEFDPVLALFNADGLGVYLNDDAVAGDDDPALPAGDPLGPSEAGIYYIAIFDVSSVPVSGAGVFPDDLIFPLPSPPSFTEVVGPTGGGGDAPVNGWFNGLPLTTLQTAYQIAFTGAEPALRTGGETVDLTGFVQDPGGTGVCAIVLASGQFMFSCNPDGPFSLTDLPRENDGTVKRQIYADGFLPRVDVLSDSVDETVVMTRAGTCPDYNPSYDPTVTPGSAGARVDISGSVLLQDTATPICAMVLANGQFMFSCDGMGSYALNIPLDANGQFKLQVYADGFAPSIQVFDEFQLANDVRMARASECQ